MSFVDRFIESNQRSQQLYQRALAVMPGGGTRGVLYYKPYPSYATRALGSRIWDVDGNERVDYCFNYTVLIHGHNHPKVVEAIKDQVDNGILLGTPTEGEVLLAEEMQRRIKYAELIRFTPTGSEAVMFALRAARAHTGRDKVAMFHGAYHGSYDAVAVGSTIGLPKNTADNTLVMPFNDFEAVEKTVRENKDDLAAVIVEPVLGSSGPILPKNDFLKHVREVTEKYNVLLILDEIITGFRLHPNGTGRLFGVEPDLATFGKIIGGGLPISAFTGRKDIMAKLANPETTGIEPGKPLIPQSGTYTAHPLATAAGVACLKELNQEKYERLDHLGNEIRVGLSKLSQELGIQYQVTGIGSLFHVFFTRREISNAREALSSDQRLIYYMDLGLLNRGVYWAPGHLSNVSTATTEEDVQQTLNAVADVLNVMKPIMRETNPDLVRG